MTSALRSSGDIDSEQAATLKDLWLRKHRHQFEGPRKVEGNLSRVLKDLIVQKLESKAAATGLRVPGGSRGNSKPGSRRPSISVTDDESAMTTEKRQRVSLELSES